MRKELGTNSFLFVATRPNGRPLYEMLRSCISRRCCAALAPPVPLIFALALAPPPTSIRSHRPHRHIALWVFPIPSPPVRPPSGALLPSRFLWPSSAPPVHADFAPGPNSIPSLAVLGPCPPGQTVRPRRVEAA